MKTIYHREEHFKGGNTIRDIVIGMSDGLTVPFALAAGISGAIAETHLVVTAGFAEIAAGSIAMGLGGYLAARSDAEHFETEAKREQLEIIQQTQAEEQEIYDIFAQYGVSQKESSSVVTALKRNPTAWKDFMMKFELGLEKPDPSRAFQSAFTIAFSYVLGGIIPLFPYILNLGFTYSPFDFCLCDPSSIILVLVLPKDILQVLLYSRVDFKRYSLGGWLPELPTFWQKQYHKESAILKMSLARELQ